jgi:hypothetical protein
LSERIDHFRADMDKLDRGEPQADIPAPQPEAAPEATPVNSLAEKYARLDPELKTALAEQATAHENARQQYLQSVQQLGNASVANLLANFPELQQGNPQQVLEQLRTQNPQRFAEISGHLQKVHQIQGHWQQLQAAQQQEQGRQFDGYSRAQDTEYDSYLASRPAHEQKIVEQNLGPMFREYGIDPQSLAQLYRSSPIVRSSQFQRMAHDLAVFYAARQASAQRGADPIPRVVRPGENISSGTDNSALAAAMRAFNADPNNPKLAAKALTARRRAAAGLR